MNRDFSPQDLAFQAEVRAFLNENLPAGLAAKVKAGIELKKEEQVAWQKCLAAKGWAAANWPVEYGGTGWTPTQRYLWSNECARAGAPDVIAFGLKMVAPIIYTYGNDEQKQRFLPPILNSDVWWCQGYSEPNAGSDLASLKTTAVRDGDSYLVNGTKTWTTLAQHADWIFCLVRTGEASEKNQKAISFLLIDMRSEGVNVSPIRLLDGSFEVNEVHFDNVRVPVANRIGEEGKGWTYAKDLLTHERTIVAGVAISKERLNRIKHSAAQTRHGESSLLEDPIFADKLARVEIDLLALEYTELRALASVSTGSAPGPESSILKIKGSELSQKIDELDMELAGYYSFALVPEQYDDSFEGERVGPGSAAMAATKYFNRRKVTIYGGSNEIQKNVICKAVLGLA